jgi:dihydroflavonol-4-reductase
LRKSFFLFPRNFSHTTNFMARALVTGANGFIGAQLAEALLARGDEVRCLVRPTSDLKLLRCSEVELVYGDVTQPDTLPAAVNGVDVVYHAAGLTKAIGFADYCRVNEAGVRNVVNVCAGRTTPPVMVLVSSLAAAGPVSDPKQLRTENDPPKQVSRYSKSKRAGELAAAQRAQDVPITIVRPPIVLGPGDRTGLQLFRSIRRARSFIVLGRGRFSMLYVADLADGLIAAAQRGQRLPPRRKCAPLETAINEAEQTGNASSADIGHGYYFLAAEEMPTLTELSRAIARSINRPYALAIRLPLAAVWLGGGLGELIGLITRQPRYFNLDRAQELSAGHWTCSSAKARRDLGFAPGASLLQRIEQTAQWYGKHHWL